MIEVGEYVRTNNGIIAQVINPNYYMEAYIECKEGLIIRNNIVKHSKNIIDLIEVGDYVNGAYVTDIYEQFGKKYIDTEVEQSYGFMNAIPENEIKTIVTKEQFAQAEYKIKEDK